MASDDLAGYDARLAEAVAAGDGPAVAAALPGDPLQRFARGFTRWLGEVEAAAVETAYAGPLAVIAAQVTAGRVADVGSLFRLLHGIQKRTALKLSGRSRRESMGGEDAVELVGRESAPDAALDRSELFRLVLAEARWLGPLRLRVFRTVRGYERAAARVDVSGVPGRGPVCRP